MYATLKTGSRIELLRLVELVIESDRPSRFTIEKTGDLFSLECTDFEQSEPPITSFEMPRE